MLTRLAAPVAPNRQLAANSNRRQTTSLVRQFGCRPSWITGAKRRCPERVPQVRPAAIALLVRLVDSESAYLILEYLPLLLRLRQHIATQILPDHIDPVLRSPKFRELRWSKTTSKDKETRAYAYQQTLPDTDCTDEDLQTASADLHPQIAIWALGEVAAKTADNRSRFRDASAHNYARLQCKYCRVRATHIAAIRLLAQIQLYVAHFGRGGLWWSSGGPAES